MRSSSKSDGRGRSTVPAPRQIASRLLRWYRKQARDLPWRRTSDPYAVWVSEIMLQQTQVATVIPYYRNFLSKYPTVDELAKAPLDRVLKVWEGMGYYARARNLHRAASIVAERHDGRIPEKVEDLAALPGIGRSTAGAIASIAFDKEAPILDGNVRRVLCRLYAVREIPTLPRVQRRLWELSEGLVRAGNPGVLNSALMDLGATVCMPKRPDCSACCLNDLCQAYREGIAETLPAKSPGKKVPHHTVAVGVIWKKGKILITRRPEKGLLGGLWEFPGGKLENGETPEEAVVREIREELNLTISVEDLIRVVRHAYSHFKIALHAFHCRYQGGRIKTELPYRWISPDELNHHPFPAANRKVIEALY